MKIPKPRAKIDDIVIYQSIDSKTNKRSIYQYKIKNDYCMDSNQCFYPCNVFTKLESKNTKGTSHDHVEYWSYQNSRGVYFTDEDILYNLTTGEDFTNDY